MMRWTARRVWGPVLAMTVGMGAFTGTAALASASTQDREAGAAASGYLNLQQCVYYSEALTDHFTTVLTPGGDGRYSTGTKLSSTADTSPTCGPGNGNHVPVPLLPGVKALDLSAGRYLNLHQCDYYYSAYSDHFTTFVPPSADNRYATGTNVSNTADVNVVCGNGNGNHTPYPALSGAKALDLTAGRYLNVHQCVYYSESTTNHLTTVVPIADNRFTTGTNVSNTADTKPSCGPGNGAHVLVPSLSTVKTFSLT